MSLQINIQPKSTVTGTTVSLPASKSISNRVLILNALAGGQSVLHNLSDANDTQLMISQINSPASIIDVEDAGTTMRFLTAYFAITNQHKTLTGTERMQERPIAILVDALRSLGSKINYLKKEGFPPLVIDGFQGQQTDILQIRGDVSSQYISALMMIAPALPKGLSIELTGKIGSRPYIEMTAALMREFGARVNFNNDKIRIEPESYKPGEVFVESDWSAASYWFAFTALAREADISLPFLFTNSLQGDHVIMDIMDQMGVGAIMQKETLKLSKKNHVKELVFDFTHCPDLAQTVAVVCAAKGITGRFTGLESLRIKETDRIAALQSELKKIGAELREEDASWILIPSASLPASATFATYKDHRMAMAFAPLATIMNVTIEDPGVVKKSYPKFWDDIKHLGFKVA